MMDGKVRIMDCVAAFLWMVTLVLLVVASVGDGGLTLRGWGLAAAAASSAATVCAVVSSACTKVLRAVHKAQLEDVLKSR